MGLEPTHPKAYAPQAYVSTIPPPGQNFEKQSADLSENFWGQIFIENFVVHPVGFEPTTNGFEDRYSSNWAMDACIPTLEMPADYSKRCGKCKFISRNLPNVPSSRSYVEIINMSQPLYLLDEKYGQQSEEK